MQHPPRKEDLPSWVEIPKQYFDLLEYEQDKFLPWYFLDRENLLFRLNGIKKRYPERKLLPFARHDYSDDVACWERGKTGKIIIIHDYASPGFESRHEFDFFEAWYEFILEEAE